MADDLITRLRKADYDCEVCWENQFHSLTTQAADEIVRLRAEVERLTNGNNVMGLLWNAERALADRLAEALKTLHRTTIIGVYHPTEELAESTTALAAYEEARCG